MIDTTHLSPLQIHGEGFVFPTLPGALCRFGSVDVPGVCPADCTNLNVTSTTSAVCPTPARNLTAVYTVEVLQNGITADPTLLGTHVCSCASIGMCHLQACASMGMCIYGHHIRPHAPRYALDV